MSDKQQTLRCQFGEGHDWTRPAQRGKPPRFCPEHKPAAEAGSEPRKESQSGGGDQAKPERVNPFIAKAQNPFIRKAQQKKEQEPQEEAVTDVTVSEKEPKQTRQEKKVAERIESHTRRFPRREFETITDDSEYNDATITGIKISNISRDIHGDWHCVVTLNEEKFECLRHGGWMVKDNETGKWREMKRNVSAAVQAYVVKIERAHDKTEEEPKKKRGQKTLEQVADEVVPADNAGDYTDPGSKWNVEADMLDEVSPLPETHASPMPPVKHSDEIEDMIEEAMDKVCECCEREPTSPEEEGWIIDPAEGVDICPECAAELGAMA